VKICGVTRVDDALAALAAGADAVGVNFWPSSKRYCEPARARALVAALPKDALVYGVFVRASRAEIEGVIRETGIGGVQLHGEEPEAEALGWSLPVLRAVAATSRDAVAGALGAAREQAGDRDGGYRLLVDNALGGGSGLTVEPELLDGLDLSRAVLAGGLTPENVAASVSRLRPFGVDTAGGVETSPGVKDAARIEAFVREARRGDGAS
jgi:phosphoribosylanthranilate isomerase